MSGDLSALFQGIPFILGIAFVYLLYLLYMRHKYSKEVEGKLYSFFFTKAGRLYGALCKEDKGCVEAPKGHDIGMYFVDPSCTYDFRYPPGKSRFIQVSVRATAYIENNPVPRVSVHPEEWVESVDMVKITSFMIETAANESFQKSALEMQKSFWGEITQIVKFIKDVPMMKWFSLGALGAAGIAAYFAYMSFQFLLSRFP